jgi:uncharacterized protein (DUF4415 family)
MPESKENNTRVTRDEARRLKGETDYGRIDALTDADIAKAVADDPDAPPIDIDWIQARLSLPPGKDMVTLRLDRDVLDWLRPPGQGLPDPHQPGAASLVRRPADAKPG